MINDYIYLGQNLEYNSTSLPIYRSVHFWKSILSKDIFPFDTKIYIPPLANLGMTIITINATLIIQHRRFRSYKKRFFLVIKGK